MHVLLKKFLEAILHPLILKWAPGLEKSDSPSTPACSGRNIEKKDHGPSSTVQYSSHQTQSELNNQSFCGEIK